MQNAQQSWHLTSEVKFLYQPDSLALRVSTAQLYGGIINIDPKLDCVPVHLRTEVAFHIILTNWRSSQEKRAVQDLNFIQTKQLCRMEWKIARCIASLRKRDWVFQLFTSQRVLSTKIIQLWHSIFKDSLREDTKNAQLS